jgi:hypothetical protein
LGAMQFMTFAGGRTPEEAFKAARAQAQEEHTRTCDDDDYSGSIADKDGFLLVELPDMLTVEAFTALLEQAIEPLWRRRRLPDVPGIDPDRFREAVEEYAAKDGWAVAVQVHPDDPAFAQAAELPLEAGQALYYFCGWAPI